MNRLDEVAITTALATSSTVDAAQAGLLAVDLDLDRGVVELLLELHVAQGGDLLHRRAAIFSACCRTSARFGAGDDGPRSASASRSS